MISPVFDSLWINARIATLCGGRYSIIPQGALAVQGDRIAWIGAMSDLPADVPTAETHDCNNAWITPGLIDCHTHLIFGGNRVHEFEQRLNGVSYEEIARSGGGIFSTVRATRAQTEDTLFASAAHRLQTLMAEGVTTVEIKSGYGLDLDNELAMLRLARKLAARFPLTIRTTFLGAHAIPAEFSGRADAYIDYLCEAVLPVAAQEGLVDAVDAFMESIAFNREQVTRLFACAARLKLPVKLHADQLSDGGGALLAAQHRALSADHLEYASEAGIVALAAAQTVAVLLPGPFYFLRETRLPPIDMLRRHGVPMAVASDLNPGTSPIVSLLANMHMACTQFGLTPEEALAGVTIHAARALGLAQTCGTLEAGKRADFVLWNIDSPAELCYWMGGIHPQQVVRGGRCLHA